MVVTFRSPLGLLVAVAPALGAALAHDDIGEGPDFAAGWSSATAAE